VPSLLSPFLKKKVSKFSFALKLNALLGMRDMDKIIFMTRDAYNHRSDQDELLTHLCSSSLSHRCRKWPGAAPGDISTGSQFFHR